MKIVKVVYTTTVPYAAQNQVNIQNVMSDLQRSDLPGINYSVCLCADGKTFMHLAFFRSDDDQKILNELPSFKHFQEQLKANGFEIPPVQELLTLAGTSKAIFKEQE